MLWEERWQNERSRFDRLGDSECVRFAAACLDRATRRLYDDLRAGIDQDKLRTFFSGLNLLWYVSPYPALRRDHEALFDHMIDQVQGIGPVENSPEMAVHGWGYLLMGLMYGLACARGPEFHANSIRAAALAYQAVWFQQIHAHPVMEPLVPSESDALSRQLELRNQVCQEDLAFQLECLARLEAGQDVERSTDKL
jgi:hypothetical protein